MIYQRTTAFNEDERLYLKAILEQDMELFREAKEYKGSDLCRGILIKLGHKVNNKHDLSKNNSV